MLVVNTVQVLQGARDLISEPEKAGRDYFANAENGERVCPLSPLACCWSPIGAMLKVAALDENGVDVIAAPLIELAQVVTGKPVDDVLSAASAITLWVERRTTRHVDVLRAFDEAIADASGEELYDENADSDDDVAA